VGLTQRGLSVLRVSVVSTVRAERRLPALWVGDHMGKWLARW